MQPYMERMPGHDMIKIELILYILINNSSIIIGSWSTGMHFHASMHARGYMCMHV